MRDSGTNLWRKRTGAESALPRSFGSNDLEVLEISDAELHLTRKYQTAADFASGMKKLNR